MSNLDFVKTTPVTDDYILTEHVLGYGINGKVIECHKRSNNQKYALKVITDNVKARREVEIHWQLTACPYIVDIIDIYWNENSLNTNEALFFIVMECMEGGELFERIQDRQSNAFTEREAAEIVVQIASAIKYLHDRDIAHRDLKPENLLYTKMGADGALKLTDFGFAKKVTGAMPLKTPCYTPYYVAPEVLSAKDYDKKCDMWALGVIIYILLCGYPPFFSSHGQAMSPGMKFRIKTGQFDFPDAEWANISQSAKQLIRQLLTTDSAQRLSIEDVFQNDWIAEYTSIPSTPLCTGKNLKEVRQAWGDIQEEMNRSLASMRVDYDQIHLKTLENVNNALLDRRRNK